MDAKDETYPDRNSNEERHRMCFRYQFNQYLRNSWLDNAFKTKNTYPWLHHDLNGHDCSPVEVSEYVDISKEDGRVELEQQFAEHHAKDWAKQKRGNTKNISQQHQNTIIYQ